MKQSFGGKWRIVEMELWDRADIDLLGPAFIEFDDRGSGQFRFIAVEGFIDCRFSLADARARVEFSWDGTDDSEARSGRGWAEMVGGHAIEGRFYIHLGDDSAFRAERRQPGPRSDTETGTSG